jgi:hypothetical protein
LKEALSFDAKRSTPKLSPCYGFNSKLQPMKSAFHAFLARMGGIKQRKRKIHELL